MHWRRIANDSSLSTKAHTNSESRSWCRNGPQAAGSFDVVEGAEARQDPRLQSLAPLRG